MRLLYIPDAKIIYEEAGWGTGVSIAEFSNIEVHTFGEYFFNLLCGNQVSELDNESEHLLTTMSMYDGIVMHSRFLVWINYFREKGIYTAFHIIPDYNYFDVKSLFGLYVAARSKMPFDQIYCGSQTASKGFGWSGFNTQPFYPLGIDYKAYNRVTKYSKKALKEQLGLDTNKHYLVITGRVTADRFITEFLETIAPIFIEFSNIEVIVAGRFGDNDYIDTLDRLTDKFPLSIKVDPDKSLVSKFVRAASLSIVPGYSPNETYCRTMFESLATGTPCLLPNHGSFIELLSEIHSNGTPIITL